MTYSGTRKKAMMGKAPTSHCKANAVLNADGLVSETKARTTPRPTACITTMKKGRAPRRIPFRRGGAIFQPSQLSIIIVGATEHTSEA